MRAVLASLVALSALSLASCGTETGDPASPSAEGEWTQTRVEVRQGVDTPVGFAADGDEVVLVSLSDEGVLQSHRSVGGGDFEPGEPLEIDGGYPGFADPVRHDGAWWLVGSGGMVGEGDGEELAFEPRVLRSDDGLTWEAVEVSGIQSPVDIHEVIAVDGVLVAVGALRNGVDDGGASFQAATWRSEDGTNWTEVTPPDVVDQPDYEDESYAVEVGVVGDSLLAAGAVSQRAALWSSTDAGASWSRVLDDEVDDLSAISGLEAAGSAVVLSGSPKGSDDGSRILTSADGGRTFVRATDQPTASGEGYGPLLSGGGHVFTVGRPNFDSLDEPSRCYADLAGCSYGGDSDVTLTYFSADGDAWSVLETPDPDGDTVTGAATDADGDLLLAQAEEGGVVVSRWPSGARLPEGDAPTAPESVDLVTVPEGQDPEPGVRYHAPLYVHCGMEWLYLGDTPWQRTDGGPEVETGAGDGSPDGWPMAGQTIYGFATLGDDGVVSYSIGGADDEVIATYEQTGATPPGCD